MESCFVSDTAKKRNNTRDPRSGNGQYGHFIGRYTAFSNAGLKCTSVNLKYILDNLINTRRRERNEKQTITSH